jgi:enoyl-[acyl-carrier-protein] reductase (NADH)
MDRLEQVAEEIRAGGGQAETAQLDALDESAVSQHAGAVAASAGSLDISVNLISHGAVQGTPLADDIAGRTMLRRAATLADVGNTAAFAASDHARSMTATALNITCGSVIN